MTHHVPGLCYPVYDTKHRATTLLHLGTNATRLCLGTEGLGLGKNCDLG